MTHRLSMKNDLTYAFADFRAKQPHVRSFLPKRFDLEGQLWPTNLQTVFNVIHWCVHHWVYEDAFCAFDCVEQC